MRITTEVIHRKYSTRARLNHKIIIGRYVYNTNEALDPLIDLVFANRNPLAGLNFFGLI
jgi:hypothetical protein